MADLGEEAFSSQMKVVATFLRLLEELMRNKQQDLRYGTKTQRRGILGRMKDFVGGIFKKVYDGTFGRLSRNGKDYGQLDLNDPAVAKLFADTMKQMGMDAMHEDNNLLFSTSDVAKILAFSKMVEQELGKKIEHENDTPEKEQSQEHGQDQERQADARGWSDYPATPEQIDLTATVLAADEGVSIDEIKKDFSENPSIGELQIALEAKGHDTMAIQPDLKNYATPEQRAQLDMLKDKGIIGENELMQLGKYPSQDKASEVLENHADAVKMLDSDEISNRAEAIRSHDGMDPDSHTKQVESWKEDLSAKVGNAFEASRDANGQPNLNNFALQCNLRGIAVQFANDGELLFTDANQHHNQKTFGETRGQSGSSSKNIQIQGRDLIDAAEIGKMNRREAILLIAGTNPLKDLKYPVEQHPNYIYLDPGRNKPGQVKNRCLYDEPFNILEYMDEIRTKDDTYAS